MARIPSRHIEIETVSDGGSFSVPLSAPTSGRVPSRAVYNPNSLEVTLRRADNAVGGATVAGPVVVHVWARQEDGTEQVLYQVELSAGSVAVPLAFPPVTLPAHAVAVSLKSSIVVSGGVDVVAEVSYVEIHG